MASRQHAHDAIAAGRVTVAGAPASKPSRLVAAHEPVLVADEGPRFVSRGGHKLDAALDRFSVDPAGRRCLDAGSSTGGFTDCLLQRGAKQVVAVDVGTGQIDAGLRADRRVDVREGTNVRHLRPEELGAPASLIVADLSFISLRLVADPLLALLTGDGDVVALVKPQFEAGRRQASKGRGVIRNAAVWAQALEEVDAAWRQAAAAMMDVMVSPLRGARGNVEFLAHFRRASRPLPARDVIEAAVAAAEAEAR